MAHRLSKAKLCVSPLTGTVFIAEVSKSSPQTMNETRVEVPESEFYNAIYCFVLAKSEDNFYEVMVGKKVVMKIEIFPDNLEEGREIKKKKKAQ
jgi:hypothetical protein